MKIRFSARVAASLLAMAGLAAAAQAAGQADDYPAGPITLLVGFPAGGPSDTAARILASRLEAEMPGARVVVENRGGANGTIAAAALTKARPDGQTLFLVTKSHVNTKWLYRHLPFDPATDFQPVALLLTMPNVLVVGPSIEAADYRGFAADAASHPDEYTVFSTGNGSDPHLAAQEFQEKTGLKFRHIPYKGGAQGMVDLLSGRVDLSFATLGTVMSYLQDGSGKVRALALGGARRDPLLPDVPTFAEVGVAGFEPMAWYGVMAPTGTPRPIVEKLNRAINRGMNQPEGVALLHKMGASPVNASVEAFAALYDRDMRINGELIGHLGVTLD
ncbi:Bug family tripartite tricarboxylate transporter substrate binding protein [Bordetella petrii]|uniref:Bug family tripartite tricarboxylate transporter substrate binding protein n=1 Tax=Bordetella petrii TaxID=94624 RepID=UPI0037312D86